jgi:regulator of protease activity HflC (stomatin/prohibitin superfamily)
MTSFVFGFFIFGIFLLITSIRVVQQFEKGLVMRVGRYQKTVTPGLVFLLPFLDSMIKVDMRTSH